MLIKCLKMNEEGNMNEPWVFFSTSCTIFLLPSKFFSSFTTHSYTLFQGSILEKIKTDSHSQFSVYCTWKLLTPPGSMFLAFANPMIFQTIPIHSQVNNKTMHLGNEQKFQRAKVGHRCTWIRMWTNNLKCNLSIIKGLLWLTTSGQQA